MRLSNFLGLCVLMGLFGISGITQAQTVELRNVGQNTALASISDGPVQCIASMNIVAMGGSIALAMSCRSTETAANLDNRETTVASFNWALNRPASVIRRVFAGRVCYIIEVSQRLGAGGVSAMDCL